MSPENVERQQQEMRNFMNLLPLTMEIAGLPQTEAGRYLNEGQMEVRATNLRNAYRIAKKMLREVARDAAAPAPAAAAPPR